ALPPRLLRPRPVTPPDQFPDDLPHGDDASPVTQSRRSGGRPGEVKPPLPLPLLPLPRLMLPAQHQRWSLRLPLPVPPLLHGQPLLLPPLLPAPPLQPLRGCPPPHPLEWIRGVPVHSLSTSYGERRPPGRGYGGQRNPIGNPGGLDLTSHGHPPIVPDPPPAVLLCTAKQCVPQSSPPLKAGQVIESPVAPGTYSQGVLGATANCHWRAPVT